MSQQNFYPVMPHIAQNANITREQYHTLYQQSITDPENFWRHIALQEIEWIKPFTTVKNTSFTPGNIHIRWFEDGILNLSVNCLDRHLATKANQTAIIWEGDSPEESKQLTYQELHSQTCRFANVLKKLGLQKGDVVALYMPMIPEAAVAMLACARIGLVHTVIFAGFSPEAIADRIIDCKAKLIITADEGLRAGRTIPLKKNIDQALKKYPNHLINKVVVFSRTGKYDSWESQRDLWWHELMSNCSTNCPAVEVKAEDPLFILYTSGSTGKPKGILHTTAGYLVYASITFRYVFDYKSGEIYWCTADLGWITGHSYLLYGPLSNGATTLIFEGVPNYPYANRLAQIVDKHHVNILYTAPTAIRALMATGDKAIENSQRSSLRIMGTVGEPINPEAWEWYYHTIGSSNCPIVDTWWQTETGGFMLTPLPGAISLKPGSATLPFLGIKPAIVDNQGIIQQGNTEGNLVFLDSWPAQARSIYGDHHRFEQTYFGLFKNMYFSGDGAKRDSDGYYWITGRVDDVLNVSGHRLGTAEIESALVSHPAISEAAVVGVPHSIKGQAIYAYVTLLEEVDPYNNELKNSIKQWVRQEIGSIAAPDFIHFTNVLPKTRSGKIMRRILRKIASGTSEGLGDTSTLADPTVVELLLQEHKQIAT